MLKHDRLPDSPSGSARSAACRIGIAALPKEAALTANADATEPGLRRLATAIRLRAVAMVAPQGFGYLGQALSAAEQYAAVYGAAYRPGTDRVVCSPGHYVIAAYAAAAETGLLAEAALASYGQNGSSLEAIGTERSPVPEYTCGSLGQGLSAAAGFALGDRLTGRDDARTFAFISDGELQEGQVWEAAMFAGHHRLARLTVLLDANNSQVDGPVDSITTIEPVAAKWQAFGWDAADLDGHDVAAIAAALAAGGHPAPGAHLPDLDPAWAGLPAARRRRALHQAARGSRRGGRRRTPCRTRPFRRRPAMTDLIRQAVLGPAVPHGAQALRPGPGRTGPRPPRGRVPVRRPDPPVRGGSVPGGVPRPVHPRGHGRGQHDRGRRCPGPAGAHAVRALVRRVHHAPAAGPDHQRRGLPAAAGADRGLHARRVQPWRPKPPGHRGHCPDARHPRHDGHRRGRRDRDGAGGRRHGRRPRPGLPAAQARRDPGDLPRRSPAVAGPCPGA